VYLFKDVEKYLRQSDVAPTRFSQRSRWRSALRLRLAQWTRCATDDHRARSRISGGCGHNEPASLIGRSLEAAEAL